MPTITALLHTHNDGLRIGRALEMLFPADELLIVDHGSWDATLEIAREYGARVLPATLGLKSLESVRGDWILALDPRESITEALAASLFEWKFEAIPTDVRAYSIFRREETPTGWIENPTAQTRLVRADWNRWVSHLPEPDPTAVTLEGELLHFVFP